MYKIQEHVLLFKNYTTFLRVNVEPMTKFYQEFSKMSTIFFRNFKENSKKCLLISMGLSSCIKIREIKSFSSQNGQK